MSWVWRIYYADGTTFSSNEGGPSDAPVFGALVISQADPDVPGGWCLLQGFNWLYWNHGMWWGGDLHGFLDQAMHFGATWPKQGRTVSNELFRAVLDRAITEKPNG